MTKQFSDQIINQIVATRDAHSSDDSEGTDKKKVSIAFEDITVPCLLVLVEKGRMGDTFSKTFRGMDLRLRNQSTLAVVVQELGRLAGWRDRTSTVPPLPKWLVRRLHEAYQGDDPDAVPKWLQREGDPNTPGEWGYNGGINPDLPVAVVSSKLYKLIVQAVDCGNASEALVRFQRLEEMGKEQLIRRDPDISPEAIKRIYNSRQMYVKFTEGWRL